MSTRFTIPQLLVFTVCIIKFIFGARVFFINWRFVCYIRRKNKRQEDKIPAALCLIDPEPTPLDIYATQSCHSVQLVVTCLHATFCMLAWRRIYLIQMICHTRCIEVIWDFVLYVRMVWNIFIVLTVCELTFPVCHSLCKNTKTWLQSSHFKCVAYAIIGPPTLI